MSGEKKILNLSWPILILVGATFLVYTLFTLLQYWRMDNPSWDLAIFVQGVRGYADFSAPIVDIKGPGYNQLGDHFSPLLMLLAPFYKIFPSPVTLLIAQCVLVAISVYPITRLGQKLVGVPAGFAIGGAYALSWGIQSAVAVQFHEYALAVPLLAFGLVALVEKQWWQSAVWIGLLLLVKEDLGFTVIAFGLVLWLRGQKRLAVIMASVGFAGAALVLGFIVPRMNPSSQYDYWNKLSEDQSGENASFFANIWRIITSFFSPDVKLYTLALLALICVGAALYSPITLMVVPTLLWRFAGSTEYYWGPTWHYSMILMPIIFVATIDTLGRLKKSSLVTVRWYAISAPWAMAVISLIVTASFPLSDLFKVDTYKQPERVQAVKNALEVIPPGASVATDTGMIVQLSPDRTVYWISTDPSVQPEYVAIDRAMWGGNPPGDLAGYAQSLFPAASYSTIFDEGGIVVARRN